jgi:ubiquinone/menaquinone biosynthesis C-methylase UbiE
VTALKSKTGLPVANREAIHEANIAVHRSEAEYYELFHPEVYGNQEQKRICTILKTVDKLVTNNQKRALDVGAGTGNLTGKLLDMGYKVTALDISPEMCQILRMKYKSFLETRTLVVINSPIEDVDFDGEEYDLITCYSVLHHLPDYLAAIQNLSVFLKKGGVIYMDHEASPFYWQDEPKGIVNFVKALYFHSNPLINSLHFRIIGVKIPSLDYTLSDYWHKKEHPIDHERIERLLKENFEFFIRKDYHLRGTWVFNPLFPVYRLVCRPEMSCWIAKK